MEKNWFNKEIKDVEAELKTDLENGLSSKQVEENKTKYGENELQEKKKEPLINNSINNSCHCIWSGRSCTRRRIYRYNNNINSSVIECSYWSCTRKQSRKIIRSIKKIK